MIQLIVGEKGKGKTKILLDKVKDAVNEVHGNIVYIDKSSRYMYELPNQVRLINTSDYLLDDGSEFIGFILGMISQDHDLEYIFLDSLLDIANSNPDDLDNTLKKLENIGKVFNVTFVLSISVTTDMLSTENTEHVILSL